MTERNDRRSGPSSALVYLRCRRVHKAIFPHSAVKARTHSTNSASEVTKQPSGRAALQVEISNSANRPVLQTTAMFWSQGTLFPTRGSVLTTIKLPGKQYYNRGDYFTNSCRILHAHWHRKIPITRLLFNHTGQEIDNSSSP